MVQVIAPAAVEQVQLGVLFHLQILVVVVEMVHLYLELVLVVVMEHQVLLVVQDILLVVELVVIL